MDAPPKGASSNQVPTRLRRIQTPFGSYDAVVVNRRRYRYVNAALPRKPDGTMPGELRDAICRTCEKAGEYHGQPGLAYAELIVSKQCDCSECRADAMAIHALAVQEEMGINLGWKSLGIDDRADHMTEIDIERMNVRKVRHG
jgi:hypothetical protein